MRDGQREWYYRELETRFPGQGLAQTYARRYGRRYECASPRAAKLWERFSAACDREGILYRMQEIIRGYRTGYEDAQLRFL